MRLISRGRSFVWGVVVFIVVVSALIAAADTDPLVPPAPPSGPGRAAYDQGVALAAKGQKVEALASFEDAVRREPQNLRYSNAYRMAATKFGEHDRSIKLFEELAAGATPPVEAYYNLGFAYIDKIPLLGEMGRGLQSKRSLKQFEKALAREPQSWIAEFGVGMNYLHWPTFFRRAPLAIDAFEKCLAMQEGKPVRPYFVLTYIRLGDAYARNDQVGLALETWDKGLTLFPNHPELTARRSQGQRAKDYVNNLIGLHSIKTIDTDLEILWKS